MHSIERRFLDVCGRRVHYRRTGQGPPVVMLHGAPASSLTLTPLMQAAAEHFTCFAPDMPGFGESDALPQENFTLTDFATATEAAMQALALPPCPVFGIEAGAAGALALAAHAPNSVTGLVLEAVPLFTAFEMETLFNDAFEPVMPDPLGAHFTRIWIRARDQFTWSPWQSRHPGNLTPTDRPPTETIQQWTMMVHGSLRSCMPASRAILASGPQILSAIEALKMPATFLAGPLDVPYARPHRLPPLKPQQQIIPAPHETQARYRSIVQALLAMPPSPPALMPVPNRLAGHEPALQFLDSEDGQLLIRCYGNSEHPAIILLHDAPGTGVALHAMARALADCAYVILPDLPGNGASDAPDETRDILEAAADALGAIADTLALDSFALAGIGCGAVVAARFALREDPRLTCILVQDMPAPDKASAQAIAPDIPLSPEGAHWLQLWLMLRDGQIYRPWFDGSVAAQRPDQGNFGAEFLHDHTISLMASRETYHRLPRAAYRTDTADLLKRIGLPVQTAPEGALPELIRTVLSRPRE